MRIHRRRAAAAATVLAIGAVVGSATAAHAATACLPFTCDGATLLLRVPSNNAPNTWGAGHIVEGGDGNVIPVAFVYTFTPTGGEPTTETAVKGGGHALANQPTTTCVASFDVQEGSLTITVSVVTRP
jgi:hypothetical protein